MWSPIAQFFTNVHEAWSPQSPCSQKTPSISNLETKNWILIVLRCGNQNIWNHINAHKHEKVDSIKWETFYNPGIQWRLFLALTICHHLCPSTYFPKVLPPQNIHKNIRLQFIGLSLQLLIHAILCQAFLLQLSS